ncbi:hypothetical protein BGZ83_011334, partial [Gryganskiella cystojenkinii]
MQPKQKNSSSAQAIVHARTRSQVQQKQGQEQGNVPAGDAKRSITLNQPKSNRPKDASSSPTHRTRSTHSAQNESAFVSHAHPCTRARSQEQAQNEHPHGVQVQDRESVATGKKNQSHARATNNKPALFMQEPNQESEPALSIHCQASNGAKALDAGTIGLQQESDPNIVTIANVPAGPSEDAASLEVARTIGVVALTSLTLVPEAAISVTATATIIASTETPILETTSTSLTDTTLVATVTTGAPAAPTVCSKRLGQEPGTGTRTRNEGKKGSGNGNGTGTKGRPKNPRPEDGYLGTITFANSESNREASSAETPPAKKSKLTGAVANKKDVANKPTMIVPVRSLDDDLFDSDSDNEDEVDPIEGEDDTEGLETPGDLVHEVISVDTTETLTFVKIMLELVAAGPSPDSSSASAVNEEIRAFQNAFDALEQEISAVSAAKLREYDTYIDVMIKNPPKAASTQRSYLAWLK